MNESSSAWIELWPQLVSGTVSGLVAGVVVTVGWGIVSGRREALHRQIDLVARWMDEFAAASVDSVRLSQVLSDLTATFDQLDPEEARDLLRDCRHAQARVFSAVSQVRNLVNAITIFDDDAVGSKLNQYIDSVTETHVMLIAAEPRNREEALAPSRTSAIQAALRRLGECMQLGHEVSKLMIAEASFRRIVRYYAGWMRRHNVAA